MSMSGKILHEINSIKIFYIILLNNMCGNIYVMYVYNNKIL